LFTNIHREFIVLCSHDAAVRCEQLKEGIVDLAQLPIIVALVVALSVAAERLVEIIKNPIGFLRDKNSDPQKEGYRKVALLVLAVVAGLVTAWLAKPAIEGLNLPGELSSSRGIIALGLLASGGSGFWNSVATYVLNLKDIKAAEAEKEQVEAKVVELDAKQIQDLQSVSERQ
jgi:hypothetical protein